jgi:DegV family protein with EDD domain
MTTAIITDSTSDIPPDIARSKHIRVVPLNVHFGDETLLDGVTIKSDEFFTRLKRSRAGQGPFPKTSQPSAGVFMEAYKDAAKTAEHIISIHLSSKVSGTYNSAVQAKQELGAAGAKIEVIDTLQASMALGLIAMQVADAVKAGASFHAASELARSLSKQAKFFGLLDTLEYLHKGGRIGRAQLFLGSLLNVKPILGLVDGIAHPVVRARGRQKGLAMLAAMARKEAPLSALCVLYGEDKAGAAQLASSLQDLAPGQGAGKHDVVTAQFGPVLGTYLGPEALGIALIKAGP